MSRPLEDQRTCDTGFLTPPHESCSHPLSLSLSPSLSPYLPPSASPWTSLLTLAILFLASSSFAPFISYPPLCSHRPPLLSRLRPLTPTFHPPSSPSLPSSLLSLRSLPSSRSLSYSANGHAIVRACTIVASNRNIEEETRRSRKMRPALVALSVRRSIPQSVRIRSEVEQPSTKRSNLFQLKKAR